MSYEEDYSVDADQGMTEENLHAGPGADGNQCARWLVAPVDAEENRLAAKIDPSEVDVRAAQYAYNVRDCDFCGCPLALRGLFVDGRLRGEIMWGNMCAACFARRGEGIGCGNGQIYARQPDGQWLLVAGWI